MKKLIIAFVAIIACISSCELEHSDNGKLDGMWHLVEIDTIETGGTFDLSQELRFWSFQMRLIEMRDSYGRQVVVVCYFDHSGDSLHIYNPCVSNRDLGDVVLTTADTLRFYGVNSPTETFYVEKLTSGKMILKSDLLRLMFKKH